VAPRSQTADRRGGTSLPFFNSGVTGPKSTKRLHDVVRSSQLNLLKSELRPFVTMKLVAMTTSLDRSEKSVQSVIYNQIHILHGENLMKIGSVDPEIICLKGLFYRKKRRGVHLRVTGQKLTNCTLSVARSSQVNFLKKSDW